LPNRYTLLLPQMLYQAMVEQAVAELPHECCGLFAGVPGPDRVRAVQRFPLINSATTPTIEYLSEPRSTLAAHKAMRAAGLQEIAVYHSHPTSDPIPSQKDRADNAYGDSLMHLIISLKAGQPVLRGWWLCDDGFEEGKWAFAEDDGVVPENSASV
jgi:[CysO sulfur-carrier protein]-S-L-cysteine hydrolase